MEIILCVLDILVFLLKAVVFCLGLGFVLGVVYGWVQFIYLACHSQNLLEKLEFVGIPIVFTPIYGWLASLVFRLIPLIKFAGG